MNRAQLTGFLPLLVLLHGCFWRDLPTHPPTDANGPVLLPSPTPDPTRVPIPVATPTPKVNGSQGKSFGPYISGTVSLEVRGLGNLPMGNRDKDRSKQDDFTLGYFELNNDPNGPLVELHARGNGANGCMSKPCKKDQVGLAVRMTLNLANDRVVYAKYKETREDLFCGEGTNPHHRVPMVDGNWVVSWNENEIMVNPGAAPGLQFTFRVPNAFALSKFVPGCPQPRNGRTLCASNTDPTHIPGFSIRVVSEFGTVGLPAAACNTVKE